MASLELKYNLILKIYNLKFYVNKFSYEKRNNIKYSVCTLQPFRRKSAKFERVVLWTQNSGSQMNLIFKHEGKKADIRGNTKC